MLLPNTDYSAKRHELGLVTCRGESDDFEYVLASNTMSFQENLEMQGFLLWARAVAENSFFRYIWQPLRRYAGLTQSQVLFTLARWFDASDDPAAGPLKTPKTIVEPMAANAAVRALFLDHRVRELLRNWWADEIRPRVPDEHRRLVDEVFRFELLTLPIIDAQPGGQIEQRDGIRICRRDEVFAVDVPAVVAALREGWEIPPGSQSHTIFELSWRLGLETYIDNHEEALLHMASVERTHALQPTASPPVC
jgi:hypothetical protein